MAVFVKPHAIFERQGDDLILDKTISFPLAALGGTATIPTLEGKVDLTVPGGTQPGDVYKRQLKSSIYSLTGCGSIWYMPVYFNAPGRRDNWVK